jgi:predicted N-acetyltransferase YhbS
MTGQLEKHTDLDLAFWKGIYTRKDQDLPKYQAYIAAEEEASEGYGCFRYTPKLKVLTVCLIRFYKEPCYYLDNLAVDFRLQRRGVGAALVRRGLQAADALRLPAQTEAGPAGEGLYLTLGFKTIATWDIKLPQATPITLPVMKREYKANITH